MGCNPDGDKKKITGIPNLTQLRHQWQYLNDDSSFNVACFGKFVAFYTPLSPRTKHLC